MRDDFLWVEKYRPRTVADTVLPAELKGTFQQFVNDGVIPNLLLTGRAGTGKLQSPEQCWKSLTVTTSSSTVA